MVVGGSCSIHAATRIIFQTFLLDNVDASNICKAACALRMFKDDPEVSGAWKDLMLKLASNPSMQEVVLLVIFQTFLLDAPVRCASWFRHGNQQALPDASPFCSGFRTTFARTAFRVWQLWGARSPDERHIAASLTSLTPTQRRAVEHSLSHKVSLTRERSSAPPSLARRRLSSALRRRRRR